MKAIKLVPCLLIMLIVMSACSATSNAGDNFGKALEEWSGADFEATELVLKDDGDFSKELGFVVAGYPDTDDLQSTTFSCINGWIGQIDIRTPEKLTFGLRVAKEEGSSLVNTYKEKHDVDVKNSEIGGVEVRAASSKGNGMLYTWQSGGFQYSLHSLVGEPTGAQLETIVSGVKAEAA